MTPSDLNLAPGQAQKFTVDAFDANGVRLPAAPQATWALQGLKGTLAPDGTFTPDKAAGVQGGMVQATAGAAVSVARVRVIPPLPFEETFDGFTAEAPPAPWINTTGKFDVKDLEGGKVLQRREDNTLTRRARVFFGTADMSDYTVEMDVRTVERRRQQGDVGVIAQRYVVVLFGNSQRVELQPWQPVVKMTASAPFAVEGRHVVPRQARGAEPARRQDARARQGVAARRRRTGRLAGRKGRPIGHRTGSPGLYADSAFGAFYDNIKVYKNAGS